MHCNKWAMLLSFWVKLCISGSRTNLEQLARISRTPLISSTLLLEQEGFHCCGLFAQPFRWLVGPKGNRYIPHTVEGGRILCWPWDLLEPGEVEAGEVPLASQSVSSEHFRKGLQEGFCVWEGFVQSLSKCNFISPILGINILEEKLVPPRSLNHPWGAIEKKSNWVN